MGMIRITGIRNKKKNGHFKKWTENLPQVFFPQIWWENLNLSRMHYCFGQPFILFILPQIAEYME